ncbi:hypothetical protein AN963_08210 [Brevibacillus choshinensis]|uniref:Uncharacterized protein n=1 Tax=Brevibacillus choshinensis TaxID=54911 RepID=A0ABR5NDS2_BRECH|nr:hypothetical protein AN963_08210 [Brevibacillus choshinensis]
MNNGCIEVILFIAFIIVYVTLDLNKNKCVCILSKKRCKKASKNAMHDAFLYSEKADPAHKA